jgi:hypothetical protein
MGYSPVLPKLLLDMIVAEMELWSEDRKYGLRLSEEHLSAILGQCRQAVPNETGGILVGTYTQSHDCAVVTSVSGAPIV